MFELAEGFEDNVRKLPEMKTASMAAANEIAARAQDTAPVSDNPGVGSPGDYKAGIIVQATTSGARVFASDPKSAWIEFGVPSANEPAQFILRNAAEGAGYSFQKRGH